MTFDQDDAESEEQDQEEPVEEKPAKTRRTRKTSKEDSPSEVVEEKPKTGRRVKKPSKEEDPKPVEKKAAAKKTTRKAKAEEVIENVEDEKPKRTRKTKVAEEEVNIFICRMNQPCNEARIELINQLLFRYLSPSQHQKDQLVDDKRLVILSIVLQRKQHGVRPKSKMLLRRPRRKSQKLARQHRKKKRQSQHDLGLKRRHQLNQKIQQQLQPVQHVPPAQKNKHSILCKLTAPKSLIPLYIILK